MDKLITIFLIVDIAITILQVIILVKLAKKHEVMKWIIF